MAGPHDKSSFDHTDGSRITVDGAEIHVERAGNPDGPALLFLHGGLGDIETFNAILPGFAETHCLIGIDSRGHGASTLGAETLSYRRLADDVTEVARACGKQSTAIIGHSDGGIVGLRIAAAGQLTVTKLAVIGAQYSLAANDPARAMLGGMTAAHWRALFPQSVASYERINPQPDLERLTGAVVDMWLGAGDEAYPGETIADISADTLVIRGDDDHLVSRAHALEMAELIAGAALFNLPFAGHSPHEDEPEILIRVLRGFLDRD